MASPHTSRSRIDPDSRRLPDGWVSKYSESLQIWGYWNILSSQPYHTWVHPADPQPVDPDTRRLPEGWYRAYDPLSERWAYVNTLSTPRSHSIVHPLDSQRTNPDGRPLPDGWYSVYDPVPDQWFYVNTTPRDSMPSSHTWVHPLDEPKSNEDLRPLPPGWVSKYDPKADRWFYVNTSVIPHHWTWDHPAGLFSILNSPIPGPTIYMERLATFEADYQPSPVVDPEGWLRVNREQVLDILRAFYQANSQTEPDYSSVIKTTTLCPRFLAYILMEDSGKGTLTLERLEELAQLATVKEIERLQHCREAIKSLWIHGITFVTDDHIETIVELLDLDVKGICAQIVGARTTLEDIAFVERDHRIVQCFLDLLQAILDYPRLDPRIRPRIIEILTRLAQRSGLYPRSLFVSGLLAEQTFPVAGGAYGDVYVGNVNDRRVAAKVVRVFQNTDFKKLYQSFAREIVLWRLLSHPNVLPFYGVSHWQGDTKRLCLISPWIDEGTVVEFLKKNPDVNRVSLVHDVSQGLEYLHIHKPPIVHGDIKGDNILIAPNLRACLADFGLARAADPRVSASSWTGGAFRWQAPELLEEGAKRSLPGDIYALGCVAYEICTGHVPFYETSSFLVIKKILEGERPVRPTEADAPALDDAMWEILESCWKQMPVQRLTATQVAKQLETHPSQHDYVATPPWDAVFTFALRADLGIYPPGAAGKMMGASASLPGRHRPTVGAQDLPPPHEEEIRSLDKGDVEEGKE